MLKSIRITLAAAAILFLLPLAAQAIQGDQAKGGSLRERIMEKALRRGDRGAAVSELQQMLRDSGYDPGPVDGIFGPLTEASVMAAQAKLNLGQDGLFGRQTLAALTATPSRPAAQESRDPVQAVPALVFHTSDGTVLGSAPDTLPASGPNDRRPGGSAGRFALTFNGAVNPDVLPRLLETLARHNMTATFFIQGDTAMKRPELVARIAAAGHEIGNGGFESIDMSRLTGPMMEAQLRHTQKLIQAATGQTPTHFRPPLGRVSGLLSRTAASMKLTPTLWTNVTVTDPEESDPTELAARLTETVYPGAVIMLHQDRESSVTALDRFLADARTKGYVSTTVSNLDAQVVEAPRD